MEPAYQEIIRQRLELPLHEGPDKTATLEEAVAPRLGRFEAPTADELGLIRLFDPRRYFLGEFS